MMSAKAMETEQEYLWKFTTAGGSILGTVTDAEKTGLIDFLLDEEEEENDNYEIPWEEIGDERILEN